MTDQEALELAITTQIAKSDAHREHIESKLNSEHRREIGEFCAYSCQSDTLGLKPWEEPPCWVDDEQESAAGMLLRRMLAAGASRYHPDPLAALARVRFRG